MHVRQIGRVSESEYEHMLSGFFQTPITPARCRTGSIGIVAIYYLTLTGMSVGLCDYQHLQQLYFNTIGRAYMGHQLPRYFYLGPGRIV